MTGAAVLGVTGAATATPALVVTAEAEHGVAAYARDLARAVETVAGGVTLCSPEALTGDDPPARAHLHFTDRLWASSPEAAADRLERLAARTELTVTLHDLPQPSDGARNLPRRADCYRRVVAAATGVVCNSRHEAALLDEFTLAGAVERPVGVVPLPVDLLPAPAVRPEPDGSVALLGFFYPGKGHAEVVAAVAALEPGLRSGADVVALGRASAGHEAELAALVEAASARGVPFGATGYLSDDDLLARCRSTSVPVAAHVHVSASGSLTTWISAGRRPLVPDTRYSREMAGLRPGTLTLVPDGGLVAAIAHALEHPESTWISADASTAPGFRQVAEGYLAWWAGRAGAGLA